MGLPHSSLRSIQVGFNFWMRASFLARDQPLSCFSRAMALAGVVIALVVDETVAVVVRGEPFEGFVFVFSDAWFDATRYTDVECVGAAGDDVDVIPAFAHVESVASFSRLSK
jgi:uncharacterized membrane protein